MKVLLIDPPFRRLTGVANFYFPVGLAYLASVLRQKGHQASILDVDVSHVTHGLELAKEREQLERYLRIVNAPDHAVWLEVRQALEEFQPQVVGITAMTPKLAAAFRVAAITKDWKRDCWVVLGGPHPTVQPEETLQWEPVDFVVKGEGETAFLQLVDALGQGPSGNWQTIPGLSWRQDGKVHHGPAGAPIGDLDSLPHPARDLLRHQQNYTTEDLGMVMSSRGCPYSCSYCSEIWGKRVRNRSVDNVMEELQELALRYRVRQISFKDDTFTTDRRRVSELCRAIISSGLKVNWDCTTRVNLLNGELLGMMVEAGCNMVKVGVETGSPRILREIDKGINFEQVREAARQLNKHHVFWQAYFMMGLPTETKEDIEATYHFMKELNPPYASIGLYKPFPGTRLFQSGMELGLVRGKVDPDHFFNTNPLDYYLIDPTRRVLSMDEEELESTVELMVTRFHQHNTRFGRLLQRAVARRYLYLKDPNLVVRDGRRVFNWVVRRR